MAWPLCLAIANSFQLSDAKGILGSPRKGLTEPHGLTILIVLHPSPGLLDSTQSCEPSPGRKRKLHCRMTFLESCLSCTRLYDLVTQ